MAETFELSDRLAGANSTGTPPPQAPKIEVRRVAPPRLLPGAPQPSELTLKALEFPRRIGMEGSGEARLLEILTSVKTLAKEYYDLTGRPLGVTGEMAEFEAHRLLQVELTPVRQPGYDAIERVGSEVMRLQIKGRCLQPDRDRSPRIGRIDVEHDWDRLLMVLMDQNFDATEIVEATRTSVQEELEKPGSKARNERHSLSVSKVRAIGLQRWPLKPG